MELNAADRYRSIVPLYGSFLAAAIFLSGIGRYNTLLVIAAFYLLESILLYRRMSTNLIKPVFGPAVAVAAIIDIMLEGNFPFRLAGAFGVFAVAELVSQKHLVAVVEGLTRLRLFGQCPSCNFANRDLVGECKNCGFSAISGSTPRKQEYAPVAVPGGICAGTKLRIPKGCLSLLNLQEDERCIASVRIFPERGVYEDGGVVLVKYLVITNARLILVDYQFYVSGWRFRRDIPLDGVETSILVRRHRRDLFSDGANASVFAHAAYLSLGGSCHRRRCPGDRCPAGSLDKRHPGMWIRHFLDMPEAYPEISTYQHPVRYDTEISTYQHPVRYDTEISTYQHPVVRYDTDTFNVTRSNCSKSGFRCWADCSLSTTHDSVCRFSYSVCCVSDDI